MRVLVLCCLFISACLAAAQRGAAIHSPESLTGVWETQDGYGGIAGMLVSLNTEVAGLPKTLARATQTERDFTAMLYHQQPAMVGRDWGYFTDGPGAKTRWDGRHLRILYPPDNDVALEWDPQNDVWRGHFARNGFVAEVVLRRPSSGRSRSVLVGTWARRRSSGIDCLHIAQRADGTLLAWTDRLQLTGLMNWGRFQPPTATWESYGERAGIEPLPNGLAEVTSHIDTAVCCTRTEFVKPLPGGTQMSLATGDAARGSVYKRIAGNSCANAKKTP